MATPPRWALARSSKVARVFLPEASVTHHCSGKLRSVGDLTTRNGFPKTLGRATTTADGLLGRHRVCLVILIRFSSLTVPQLLDTEDLRSVLVGTGHAL